ncbi:MAG: hypothetical protein VCD00_00790 [Candidatus Hydrogenedentota bacterium]
MDSTLTRREMLVLVSYASLGLTGTFSETAFASEKALRKAFRRLSKRAEMEPLRTVGRMYIELTPKEGDVGILLQNLPNTDALDADYWDVFSSRIKSDFVAGETVTLQGWLLSQSECRLYGLLHLLAP